MGAVEVVRRGAARWMSHIAGQQNTVGVWLPALVAVPQMPDSSNWYSLLQIVSTALMGMVCWMLKGIYDDFRQLRERVDGPRGLHNRMTRVETILEVSDDD